MISASMALASLLVAAMNTPGAFLPQRGAVHFAQAKIDELANLRRRVGLDPTNADLQFRLARELTRRGEHAESARIFRQLIAAQPKDADYHLGLGQSLLWSGKPQEALVPLRTAVGLAPGYEDAQSALGRALLAAGRLPDARRHWTESAKRFPKAKWPGEGLAEMDRATVTASMPTAVPPPLPRNAPEISPPTAAPIAAPIAVPIAAPAIAAAPVVAAAPLPAPELAVPPTAAAPPKIADVPAPTPSRTLVEAGLARERLSSGIADWTEQFVVLGHATPDRAVTGSAKFSRTERFGLKDTTTTIALGTKLAKDVAGSVELAVSPTHRVLAKRSLHGGLSFALPQGYGVGVGIKQTAYNTSRLLAGDLTLERYVGDYRVAYSIHPSQSSTAGNALGHRLQLGRFYGDDNQIQLLLVGGNEIDRPELGIVNESRVRAVALFGRHWLTPNWAISYAASHTKQDRSRRDGFTISLICKL